MDLLALLGSSLIIPFSKQRGYSPTVSAPLPLNKRHRAAIVKKDFPDRKGYSRSSENKTYQHRSHSPKGPVYITTIYRRLPYRKMKKLQTKGARGDSNQQLFGWFHDVLGTSVQSETITKETCKGLL